LDGDHGPECLKEDFDRLQLRSIQFLKISNGNPEARASGLLERPAQQRGLAHLAGAFEQENAVATPDGLIELIVNGPDDVELGIQRHGAPFLFEFQSWRGVWRGRRIQEGARKVIDEALVVLRSLPKKILERIHDGCHLARELSGELHANRKQSWLARLRLAGFMRELDLVGKHVALNGLLA
jgi:hypothetical protein